MFLLFQNNNLRCATAFSQILQFTTFVPRSVNTTIYYAHSSLRKYYTITSSRKRHFLFNLVEKILVINQISGRFVCLDRSVLFLFFLRSVAAATATI